ncbi:Fic family protein [Demequina capsici]|uniref:Fic family protein n=1 Tax=Demequina capsici TaxID=3075620 RepID=A0AA96FB16_9MICO|nr:Fic family protein [Demequina sp. PMTSA13]WNM26464.1 Fic family protein [Demequina sp. PMTSA13]
MTRYLPVEVILRIIDAERIGPVRDLGLLQSALDRPATTVLGEDAYADLGTKAAALLHSLCLNHALVDGNKRIAALCAVVFLEINGVTSGLDNDGLFELTMSVADGSLRDVDQIAARLAVSDQ